MTAPDQLFAAAVAATGWPALLPAHRRDGSEQPTGRPSCVDALALDDGLVLAVVADGRERTYPVPLVVRRDGTGGVEVRRAEPGDGAAEALVARLAADRRDEGAFQVSRWHHREVTGERGITVDQTNESVVVGERAIVKWLVVADEGPHPAPTMLTALVQAGFGGTPRPWGAVEWRSARGSAPRLLALAVEHLPGAVDGWTWAVADLRAAAAGGDPGRAAEVGRRTGELVASFHAALAGTARPATAAEVAGWRTRAHVDLDRALEVTNGAARDVLAAMAASVRRAFDSVPVDAGTPVLRVHGDLHVGQVLRMDTDRGTSYSLTDFDGNPVLPAAERLREQPAALDAAGMAQSLVHAALVVRRHHSDLDGGAVERAGELAAASFLDAFRVGLGEHADLLDERLLRPFRLQQVCREFIYAATHLPRWSYVPEAALPMLLREDRP
ncbi:MAG TPA: hypothetical protein VFG72_08530 [Marmoricola sp.]|nr:hypothetical protein [Marmoricola sp.]